MTRGDLTAEKGLGWGEAAEKEHMQRLIWFMRNYDKLVEENRKPRKKLTEGVKIFQL